MVVCILVQVITPTAGLSSTISGSVRNGLNSTGKQKLYIPKNILLISKLITANCKSKNGHVKRKRILFKAFRQSSRQAASLDFIYTKARRPLIGGSRACWLYVVGNLYLLILYGSQSGLPATAVFESVSFSGHTWRCIGEIPCNLPRQSIEYSVHGR